MIRSNFEHCKTIDQFYKEISRVHREAHGTDYTAHHNEMFSKLPECKSYRELGIMQGATAACAVVAGITDLHLIDLDISNFVPYSHLFRDIDLRVDECDDLKVSNLIPVDFLLIDSVHTYSHVKKQLELHPQYVNKYILFHDTEAQKGVKKAIDEFILSNSEWCIEKHFSKNVGYTLIKRTNNDT